MPPSNNNQTPIKPVEQSPSPQSPQAKPFDLKSTIDSLKKDVKFIDTIKTFVIYGCVLWLTNDIVNMLFAHLTFSGYHPTFNILVIVLSIIIGAISSLIGGALFYYFFDMLRDWVKANPFLSGHINSLFNLFWKPFLVSIIIGGVFGLFSVFTAKVVDVENIEGVATFGALFASWLIVLVLHSIIYFMYSKLITDKLRQYYKW